MMNSTSTARPFLALTALTLATAAHAQSNVDSVNKYSWNENCGWMNWRDAGSPSGAQGAFIAGTFLSGMVWQENTGFINLGDGTPVNGFSYGNSTGADSGVNILGDGRLEGLAWGENIGWLNFGLFATLPAAQQAQFDNASGRLRGYAWSENIGWVNLDDSNQYVGIACPADFNLDGDVDFFDYLDFVDVFSLGVPEADFNHDSAIDFFDYLDFVDAFSIGC